MYKLGRWVVVLLCMELACGKNLYTSVTPKQGDAYYFQEAQIALNKEDYEEAETMLGRMSYGSPEGDVMQVAITLGKAGLSFWKILLSITDAASSSQNSQSASSGMDQVFNLLSQEVFGTGQTRVAKVAALHASIQTLEAIPSESKRVKNLQCMLAGILALPSVLDGTTSIATATLALEEVQKNLTSSATSGRCPNLDGFSVALDTLSVVQSNLELILTQTSGCSFLSFINQDASLNKAQEILKKALTHADKGCAELSCSESDLACLALQLPCIQEVMGDVTAAVSGDGEIDRCELLQNCRTPGICF